jgi:hypothetical protein
MNHDTTARTTAARWVDSLLRVLASGDEVGVESELLKHFPFVRQGERSSRVQLRIPTTVHGSL